MQIKNLNMMKKCIGKPMHKKYINKFMITGYILSIFNVYYIKK
jgi:hypothetical protein